LKILVLSLSGIGDTLIATPFLHELRDNFPQAQIDAFVLWQGSADLLEGNPHVSRVLQKNLIKDGAWKSLPFLRQLRRERYDVSVNVHTQGRIQYRMVARFIGAKLRISHAYENHGVLDRLLVQKQIPQDYTVQSIENNRRLLPLLGAKRSLSDPGPEAHPGDRSIPAGESSRPSPLPIGWGEGGRRPGQGISKPQPAQLPIRYEIYLSDVERAWADRYLAENGLIQRRKLGLHVGSGGTKNLGLKRWPLERYIELLQGLTRERPDLAILLFGGPEEQQAHARIRSAVASPNLFFPDSPNLRQAGALIGRCDAFLSVDTALMHLAAAVGVPKQIVIEAPTLNPTNLPPRPDVVVIRNPAVGGRNLDYYRYDGGPIRGTDAEITRLMESVTMDAVRAVLGSALL
jgi:ADP-heptose:LPS heptosyltransferase